MPKPRDKSIMRSLGEFVGHIVKGAKTDPAKADPQAKRQTVRREVEEEQRGDITLRRTTIEEIEFRDERE